MRLESSFPNLEPGYIPEASASQLRKCRLDQESFRCFVWEGYNESGALKGWGGGDVLYGLN